MIELQVDCNECGNRCKKTHNLKIHKWSDVKSIAINVEWIAGQRTIFRLENDRIASRLQWMWKEMQEDEQFENSQMIGCQVDCNKCGMRCGTTHKLLDYESIAMIVEKDAGQRTFLKLKNDRMAS